MIDRPDALDALLARLERAEHVAIDTEFHTERRFAPELMLLQLKVDDDPAVLVDPRCGLDLRPLGGVLSRRPLLAHAAEGDVRILAEAIGLQPQAVFDTQVAAAFVGLGWPERLQALADALLGVVLPKRETLSDWSRRPLSEGQRRYAEDDVEVLPGIARVLEQRLRDAGRLEVARAAMAERLARMAVSAPDESLWRSIGGAERTTAVERAVLQALTRWRVATARSRDLPPHQVLNDGMLLDLARRRPRTLDGLRDNRRFPSAVVKRDGDALLAVIAEGASASPPPPLRDYPRAWADAWRAAVPALAPGVAPEIVLDDATLSRVHGGGSFDGWRAALLGERAEALRAGQLALTLDGRLVRAGA